ncbi:type I glyceraldehyde-3-phosphate dehydrogenase [Candidatus Bipolaricaulota bacterium]|nr:type I glyceraldehyde-3-phosphate dehydrogenase [Candidatus Bipolaricaulota bacterium]
MKKVAINGFGRIGRAFFRSAFERKDMEIVAINDPFITPETARYLLSYDSVYLRYGLEVVVNKKDKGITVDGVFVPLLSEEDPQNLPWLEKGIDLVIESTGAFLSPDNAGLHLKAGAARVLLSAPPKEGDIPQIVYGVNHETVKLEGHKIVSAASCTTNSLVPIAHVLEREFGIVRAFLTTVHGYTGDQRLVDAPHKRLSRSRAAAVNIIPTTTGAAQATAKVIPALVGKMDGIALRVPVVTGSVSDFTVELQRDVSIDEVNKAFCSYAKKELAGILGVSEDPIVSTDIIGDPRASVVDLSMTKMVDRRLIKVLAFYDNEWGYTSQLVRVATIL